MFSGGCNRQVLPGDRIRYDVAIVNETPPIGDAIQADIAKDRFPKGEYASRSNRREEHAKALRGLVVLPLELPRVRM